MNILETILKENFLVFDVGCNIGKKSVEYLSCGTKLVGCELQPNCFDKLTDKFKNV